MDAKDRLRRYLEQRREMGESEFALDTMSIEEAMKVIGSGKASGASPMRPLGGTAGDAAVAPPRAAEPRAAVVACLAPAARACEPRSPRDARRRFASRRAASHDAARSRRSSARTRRRE